jgi:hypothetical protein
MLHLQGRRQRRSRTLVPSWLIARILSRSPLATPTPTRLWDDDRNDAGASIESLVVLVSGNNQDDTSAVTIPLAAGVTIHVPTERALTFIAS